MLIHEEINNDNNRMEVGPGEYRKQVKCDRCGKVKPDGLEAILWYCNDYEKGIFGSYKYESKDYSSYEQVDYCPKCVKTKDEKKVVLNGMYKELSGFIKMGFGIGRGLENLISQQRDFQKDCIWFMNKLNSFQEFNTERMEKKIKAALNYSIVNLPNCSKMQYVQMTLC